MSDDLAQTTGVAGRYASALFDLARDAGVVDQVERELIALANMINTSAELKDFIASPVYDTATQANVVDAIVAKSNFGPLTQNFLKLVTRNRRLFVLPAMISAYQALAAEARGEVKASAISAAPLSSDQAQALRRELEAMVGKAVNLETSVDANLLGGLVVKIGSRMIDASLKTKLDRLKTVMKEA